MSFASVMPALSLLDQGSLDKPCAPLLIVNGKEDKQVPLEDFYLLLEHGEPEDDPFISRRPHGLDCEHFQNRRSRGCTQNWTDGHEPLSIAETDLSRQS